MIQDYTYHCHTDFSDGKNSLEEMVAKAKALGFSHMGISDHLIVHKNIEQSPSWQLLISRSGAHIYKKDFKTALPAYQKHCEEIRELSRRENFKIYVGFEVDFFTYDGWLDEFKEFLAQLDYDYVISGNHFLFDEPCETIYNIDKRLSGIIDKPKIQRLISSHFKTIAKSAESRMFKFVAHLDYVRKMGTEFCADTDFLSEKEAVISALKNSVTGTEISTKGLRKVGDFYPSGWFLEKLKEQNIPLVISDDAHRVEELGFDFDMAEEKLSELKISNRIKF